MPKVTGIFSQFAGLDQIPTEDISQWLKVRVQTFYLENYIANLILYPQTAPISENDIDIELAILREILKKNPQFINFNSEKLFIPLELFNRFPPIKLVWALLDVCKLVGVVKIILKTKNFEEILGSVIVPKLNDNGQFNFKLDNKNYLIKQGSLQAIPCLQKICQLNKKEGMIEVYGGELGLIIDARKGDLSGTTS